VNLKRLIFQCPFFPWKDLRIEIPNCTKEDCFLEDAVWEYARRNLAVLNIFIKVCMLPLQQQQHHQQQQKHAAVIVINVVSH